METIKGTDTVRLLWSAWDYVMDENMQNEMDIEYRKELFVLCYIFIFIMAMGRAFILVAQSLPAEENKEKEKKKHSWSFKVLRKQTERKKSAFALGLRAPNAFIQLTVKATLTGKSHSWPWHSFILI